MHRAGARVLGFSLAAGTETWEAKSQNTAELLLGNARVKPFNIREAMTTSSAAVAGVAVLIKRISHRRPSLQGELPGGTTALSVDSSNELPKAVEADR